MFAPKVQCLGWIGLGSMLVWFACGIPTQHRSGNINDAGEVTFIPGRSTPPGTSTTHQNNPPPDVQAQSLPEQVSGQEPGNTPSPQSEQAPPTVPENTSPPDNVPPPPRPNDKPDTPDLFDNGTGQRWVGDACNQNSDCDFDGGFCQQSSSGYPQGHCTRLCTQYCPDRAGRTFTFCIPQATGGGYCVLRCDKNKYPQTGCRLGYSCEKKKRINQASVEQEVCVPTPTQPPPPPVSSWIGEACTQDTDCDYQGGYCLKDNAGYPQGQCSLTCTGSCPDKSGKPITFCIANSGGGGHCVSRCNTTLYPQGGCRTGYACQNRSRYNQSSVTQDVCVPTSSNPPPNQDRGTYVANMYITYYYLSREVDYSGSANTALYDKNCNAITQVPSAFSDSVCIEGSGILKDGRVINYATTCNCGRRCPTGGIICYSVLDKNAYPWGAGAASRPLRPLRSLAVDRNKIAIGTKLYIPEWDGVYIPSVDGIGGFTHDGCLSADDVGGAIVGNHFDFFSGTSGMWKALEKIHNTKKYLTVYKNPGRCP